MCHLLLVLLFLRVASATDLIVKISDGALRGSVLKDIDDKEFFSFQGIPFAKPPVGELRFKDPQPLEKWTNVRNATKEPPTCIQKLFFRKGDEEFSGDEDCLYLNVYTPKLSQKKLLSVIVFIHGGGFMEGSGVHSYYGPEFLISQNVVVVTINYRLGVYGFLSFKNSAVGVPGNAGMKDQTAAFRWVQKNIRSFGGDPRKVTISGESAGGASVHLHVLSPLSQGLFRRAVMHSGNALTTWCNGDSNNGVVTAKILGFEGNDEVAMLKFLQTASQEQLKIAVEDSITVIPIHIPNRFGPSIEEKSKNAFMFEPARNIIKNGNFDRNVQLMIGVTSSDGLLMDVFYSIREGVYNPFPAEMFIPYYFDLNPIEKTELVKKIDCFYKELASPYDRIALQTDSYFFFPTYETVLGHLPWKQDIYLYLFSSKSELNILQNSSPVAKDYDGACHMDDMWYLYSQTRTPASAYVAGSIENNAIKNSVRLLANFVKYGKPTLPGDATQWKKVSKDSINYIDINLSENTPGVDLYKNRSDFWCEMYEHYNQNSFCSLKCGCTLG